MHTNEKASIFAIAPLSVSLAGHSNECSLGCAVDWLSEEGDLQPPQLQSGCDDVTGVTDVHRNYGTVGAGSLSLPQPVFIDNSGDDLMYTVHMGQAACTASLVDHGVGSSSLRYVGGDWASGSDESGDYITKGGTGNYIWFDYDLGSLDMTITMTLKLSSLGSTASLFTINSDTGGFGFDASGNEIWIPDGALGARTFLGSRMDVGVVDDALFDLRMQRVSSLWHLSIIVAGVTTFSYERASTEAVVSLGYRPHRSTVKIYEWDVQLDNSDCQAHASEFQAPATSSQQDITGWVTFESQTSTTVCGEFGEIIGGYEMLGAGAWLEKTFGLPTPHSSAHISLNFIKIDSWDDEHATMYVDGNVWWDGTFSVDMGSSNVCGGSWNDLLYPVSVELAHSAAQLTLRVTSTLNQAPDDESWGLSDVVVTAVDDDGGRRSTVCHDTTGRRRVQSTVSDALFWKYSDDDINAMSTDGVYRYKCGDCVDSYLRTTAGQWSSVRDNALEWEIDRDRDLTFECDANARSNYVFSDFPATPLIDGADCSMSQHTNYGEGSSNIGCYASACGGWGQPASVWVRTYAGSEWVQVINVPGPTPSPTYAIAEAAGTPPLAPCDSSLFHVVPPGVGAVALPSHSLLGTTQLVSDSLVSVAMSVHGSELMPVPPASSSWVYGIASPTLMGSAPLTLDSTTGSGGGICAMTVVAIEESIARESNRHGGMNGIELECPEGTTVVGGTCCSNACPIGETECSCDLCEEEETWSAEVYCAVEGTCACRNSGSCRPTVEHPRITHYAEVHEESSDGSGAEFVPAFLLQWWRSGDETGYVTESRGKASRVRTRHRCGVVETDFIQQGYESSSCSTIKGLSFAWWAIHWCCWNWRGGVGAGERWQDDCRQCNGGWWREHRDRIPGWGQVNLICVSVVLQV